MHHLLTVLLFALLGAGWLPEAGNDFFSTRISVRGGRICSSEVVLDGSLLTTSEQAPAFEFCINGSRVKATDPCWRYAGLQTKDLSNGARIYTYEFRGKGKWKGLCLYWDREVFPDVALLRERLRLTASRPGFRLSNVDGRNHFIFPRYSLAAAGEVRGEEIRVGRFETRAKLDQNHMFHPDRNPLDLSGGEVALKGPFTVLESGGLRCVMTYEHASQDNSFMKEKLARYGPKNDEMQGVEGDVGYTGDDDLWFISTNVSRPEPGCLDVGNRIRRGGYIDGEEIPVGKCYETVWSAFAVLRPGEDLPACLQDYLYRRITDHKASRKPMFYYNTWGMQRAQPNAELRSCLTEERVFEEIEYCRQMGMDRFILDDGWQATMGQWSVNRERFPNGLEPVIRRINEAGMEAGVWLSLLAVSKSLDLYKDHPEWRINDRSDAPVLVQWGNPGFDIVSGYYDVLLASLKELVDMGVRFFKWDAVSTLSSCNAGLEHGQETDSVKDRIDRYNYLFPFYVTRLARELKEYHPDVVVELDLTEHWRNMIGLMTLQEAKFFWINNGSSRYGDYSTFRSKSVRACLDEYAGIFPPEVFTFATYPMSLSGALKYNVNSILQGGHGFWGDLRKTTPEDRRFAASRIRMAKRVLPFTEGAPMTHSGRLCDSPELYVQADASSGYALMTGFSSEPWIGDYRIAVPAQKVLAVLGHPFRTDADGVVLPLRFAGEDDSCSAFVIGDAGAGPKILSSTGVLEDVTVEDGVLRVTAATDTELTLSIPGRQDVRTVRLSAGETRLLGMYPITVLGIGDSITQGSSHHVSYLFPLRERLREAGFDVEMIGPRVQYYQGDSLNHCALGGKTIEYWAKQIDSVYRRHPADIVLIHGGHNHFAEQHPVPGIIQAHRTIIDKILAINPTAVVFVAQVIESGKLPKYSYISNLNEALFRMVREYRSDRVRLVPVGKGFDWHSDAIEDHVHPNAHGARIMAENWYSAISSFLSETDR
ncbi:MAG: alpha-galactosidase [Bacteroidales bacterium]|nr:alpha-galactosidase [Bacteroidales bacterium]